MIRHQIRTEYKVQFPYLYTSRPRAVALAPYHHPPLYYVKPDDPDLPAFYFDPVRRPRLTRPRVVLFSIPSLAVARRAAMASSRSHESLRATQVVNPISAFRSKAVKATDESEDDFAVMGLEPLLAERPLYTDATAGGIALYFAPRPFNLRRGRTRRAFDVPLVNAWFKERCERGVRQTRPGVVFRVDSTPRAGARPTTPSRRVGVRNDLERDDAVAATASASAPRRPRGPTATAVEPRRGPNSDPRPSLTQTSRINEARAPRGAALTSVERRSASRTKNCSSAGSSTSSTRRSPRRSTENICSAV